MLPGRLSWWGVRLDGSLTVRSIGVAKHTPFRKTVMTTDWSPTVRPSGVARHTPFKKTVTAYRRPITVFLNGVFTGTPFKRTNVENSPEIVTTRDALLQPMTLARTSEESVSSEWQPFQPSAVAMTQDVSPSLQRTSC